MTNVALITGAAGFLGAHVAGQLSLNNWSVIGVDRTSLSPSESSGRSLHKYNVIELPSSNLDLLLKKSQPDVIVHVAGPASVQSSISNPADDWEQSVVVTFNLLDSVRRMSPNTRVVFISSAAVYGNPTTLPIKECSSTVPLSPYGHHKLQCESLLREYHRVYGLPSCAVRIFSAYGPGLRRQLLWDICQKVSNEGVVKLHGTGEETRDYVHAKDVAHGVLDVINGASFCGESYNLASGTETSVSEVARMIVSLMDSRIEVSFSGHVRCGDPERWRADITNISNLGYTPSISLNDGISDYIKWHHDDAMDKG